MDEADLARGRAMAVEHQRLGRRLVDPLEVIGAGPILALLFAQGRDRPRHRLGPERVEGRLVPRRGPIAMGQAHGIAEAVDLPFTLGNARLHVSPVGYRRQARPRGRVLHEGVGVRIDQDAARLPLDEAVEQPAQRCILGRQMDIGLQLRRTVAQPHRIDVAGDDERVGLSVDRPQFSRGVERVGIAIFKQPADLRVRDLRLHPRDLGLDRRAGEASLTLRWALGRKGAGTGGTEG